MSQFATEITTQDDPREAVKDGVEIDFTPFEEGIKMLKFGRGGSPHEKMFTLWQNRYIQWYAKKNCLKFGRLCEVDLERVVRVQLGQATVPFSRMEKTFGVPNAIERSLSLIYINIYGKETSLDIICGNKFILKYIYRSIQKCVASIEYNKIHTSVEKRFLKDKWETADSDRSGSLSRSEVNKIVQSMNIDRSVQVINKIFTSVDIDGNESLTFAEFLKFMERLQRRRDLEVLWNQVVTGVVHEKKGTTLNIPAVPDEDEIPAVTHESIDAEQFRKFWMQIQGENITIEDARIMIANANGMEEDYKLKLPDAVQACNRIGYYEWRNLLTSGANDVYAPDMTTHYQDMTRPLSDYFIASSHNTYLEGDQLSSRSSVNRYIDDLTSGCRCVELDCWDGSEGEPIIYHGHTLTGKIKFEDVIKALKVNAFTTSPYPVILSIENHCGKVQQKKMAAICKSVLGNLLQMPLPVAGDVLPSPKDLMNKILLKGKRIKSQQGLHHEEDEEEDADDLDPADAADAAADPKKSKKKAKGEEKESDTVQELSDITFLATGKVKEYTPACSNSIPVDYMSSVSEPKTFKNLKKTDVVEGWVNHNRKHLTRIYPKGTRIDSSNYNPAPAWAAGNQMVALNYQTNDLHKHINIGKYRQNGRCGYVLKPPYMLSVQSSLSPPRPTRPIRFTLHIISGAHLPKPGGRKTGEIIDPYVHIRVDGLEEDIQEKNTKIIDNNGFNPVWDEIFQFTIKNPDVAHLSLIVNDDNDGFIAFSSIPFAAMRPGLRNVGLLDSTGMSIGDFQYASIFCRFQIEAV